MDGPTPSDEWDPLLRDPIAWLVARIHDPAVAARASAALHRALDTAGPERVHRAVAEVRDARPSPDGNLADPVLRTLLRAWIGAIAPTERAGTLRCEGPTVIVSNHLSYVDTTVTDHSLAEADPELADRLVVLAGPKVWDTPLHRLATRALSVVPTPQSEVVSGTRTAATELLRVLSVARARVREGRPLLVYPEGTRSRTGRLGSFLKGVHHYLGEPGTVVVPVALWGTEQIYPFHADRLFAGPVRIVIGDPLPVDRDPQATLAAAWQVLAETLPAPHQPAAGTPPMR